MMVRKLVIVCCHKRRLHRRCFAGAAEVERPNWLGCARGDLDEYVDCIWECF